MMMPAMYPYPFLPFMGGMYLMPMFPGAVDPRMYPVSQYVPPPEDHLHKRVREDLEKPPRSSIGREPESERVKRHCPEPVAEANLVEAIAKYHASPAALTKRLFLQLPVVAQRSYGHEKRYLCPPPSICLQGDSWATDAASLNALRLQVTCDGNTYSSALSEDERFGLHAVSKNLFVGDHGISRAISATVTFEIRTNETLLGTFASSPITIISKPIKKIRVDRPDICIKLKSPIALFNRVRGQTVSTRYLSVDLRSETGFGVTGNGWTSFEVIVASEAGPAAAGPALMEKPRKTQPLLCHGQLVCLRDTMTGSLSPQLVIRKVDKSMVLLDNDEPVSQLMKVALCLPGADCQYLSLYDGVVSFHKAIPHPESPNRAIIMEGAAWTVTATKSVEYAFADLREDNGAVEQTAIHSCPIFTSAAVLYRAHELLVEVRGDGFETLHVFLGTHRVQPHHVSSDAVHLPIPKELLDGTDQSDAAIVFARRDGVLFPAPFVYSAVRREIIATRGS